MFERTCLMFLAAGLLALSSAFLADPAGADHLPRGRHHNLLLVYEAHRPALKVSLTRSGHRIIRAGVSAHGLCEDGERPVMGFGQTGGGGIPIDAHGRFIEKYGPRSYLRGHFDRNRVIGAFRESRQRNIEGEALEPLCGNIVPRGRNQRFVARLVEVNGKKVRHPAA